MKFTNSILMKLGSWRYFNSSVVLRKFLSGISELSIPMNLLRYLSKMPPRCRGLARFRLL